MSSLDIILEYAARGWQVFPCHPGQKIPLTTHGVNDATSDIETIRAWNIRWPNANWALACGERSGVYVIDVDVDEEKGVNGWKTLETMPNLPETVCQNTPRGGAHFLFKTDNPPRNKNSLFHGIDIRSNGYYIMLAPSIHPNGKVYVWADKKGPGDIEMAEFPVAFRPPAPSKAVMPWEKVVKTPKTAPSVPVSTPIIERARLYLAECEPAIQGQAGHDKLLWAARALVVGFELDDQTAISLLWSDFNPRCVPPWNQETEAKDFERKVAEARRTPSTKPAGWLIDEFGLRDSDKKLFEYGAELAESLLASVKPITPENPPKHIQAKARAKTTDDWPQELLSPPGYVGDLAKWIIKTANRPQPKLAVIASIVGAGALFGGKVRDFSNGRTNIYGIGVAETSAGKDRPFKAIEEIFYAAGAGALLGGGRVTSDTAIELGLQNNRTQLWNIDEVGDYFKGIKRSGMGAGNSPHLSTIIPCLKQMWSCAACMYRGKQKADGEFRTITEPHACLWGLTTPGRFYEGFSSDELEDGFMPRILIAISKDMPAIRTIEYEDPPESLVTITQAWFNRIIPPDTSSGNILGAISTSQMLVETEPRARQVFAEFGEFCDRVREDGRAIDDKTRHLWGKAYENARRVALTIACGEEFECPRIKGFHAEYACKLIKQLVSDVVQSIRENMSDTIWEKEKKSIIRIVEAAGEAGISYSELTKRTQSLRDGKTRDMYVQDLIDANIILRGPHPLRPSARKGWVWLYQYGLAQMENSNEK